MVAQPGRPADDVVIAVGLGLAARRHRWQPDPGGAALQYRQPRRQLRRSRRRSGRGPGLRRDGCPVELRLLAADGAGLRQRPERITDIEQQPRGKPAARGLEPGNADLQHRQLVEPVIDRPAIAGCDLGAGGDARDPRGGDEVAAVDAAQRHAGPARPGRLQVEDQAQVRVYELGDEPAQHRAIPGEIGDCGRCCLRARERGVEHALPFGAARMDRVDVARLQRVAHERQVCLQQALPHRGFGAWCCFAARGALRRRAAGETAEQYRGQVDRPVRTRARACCHLISPGSGSGRPTLAKAARQVYANCGKRGLSPSA